MEDAEGDGFLPSELRVLNPVGFMLMGEPHDQSVVGLGVYELPGVWEVKARRWVAAIAPHA